MSREALMSADEIGAALDRLQAGIRADVANHHHRGGSMEAAEKTETESKPKKYGDLVREARELEARGAHNAAATLWDVAKDLARRTKRSTAEAVEGAMRCRAAAGDPRAAGVAKVGAILDDAAAESETDDIAEEMAALEAEVEAAANEGEGEPARAKPEKKAPKAPRKPKAASKKSAAMDAHEENLAKREATRARQNDLKVGTKLEHKVRGEVLATCTWHGPRDWRYRNKSYTSISAAANAAAAHLRETGVYKPGGRLALNGWVFWGVEKREP